jgi:hypothetical protein
LELELMRPAPAFEREQHWAPELLVDCSSSELKPLVRLVPGFEQEQYWEPELSAHCLLLLGLESFQL